MNYFQFLLSLLICFCLFLQGCISFGDESFAINVKRNHTEAALRGIQPHSGNLRITETNRRTYYPIEYALINNNPRLTYALIKNNSPTRLYGKSLAYNAAVVGNTSLASDLAKNGYGTRSDIQQGIAQNRANAAKRRQASEMAGAIGIFVLAALLGGGGGGGGGGSHYNAEREGAIISAQAQSMGQDPASPNF